MAKDLIVVDHLEKEFRLGLTRKKVHAVQGVSFRVREGEIFGFLGPNGAGKTTTIKMLMGLIRPSAGQASLFGLRVPSPEAMKQVGFLPENPYIYPFLTPREFVELCGQLSGLRGRALRDRSREVLSRTGVLYAADRPARRLSKGMLQRAALAAALVADPQLLVLDEPMSGLDPIGRKEVKDIIIEERSNGRTIFFSTHILGDVETMCDRVTILRRGKVVVEGKLDELLHRDAKKISIVLTAASEELTKTCHTESWVKQEALGHLRLEVEGRSTVTKILELALKDGAEVHEVSPIHETLEDVFVREAIGKPSGASLTS